MADDNADQWVVVYHMDDGEDVRVPVKGVHEAIRLVEDLVDYQGAFIKYWSPERKSTVLGVAHIVKVTMESVGGEYYIGGGISQGDEAVGKISDSPY